MKQNAENGILTLKDALIKSASISASLKPPRNAMINTLSIARDLSEAGIERPHAEAIANAMGTQQGDVATKDFVHAEISAVRAEIRAEISELEARLVRWIVGTVFAASGLLFAALRFIP